MFSLQHSKLLAGLVLAASLGVTYLLWQQAQQQVRQKLHSEFDFHAHEIIDLLEQRMAAYEQVLLGVRAFFDSSEVVNRDEFNSYISSLRLNQHYPGIQGVGYTQIVPANRKAEHIASIRQQGFPEYTIHPSGERDFYMVVVYIEPLTERNARVLGYDTYVESIRRTSLDQARDSGRATISAKLKLVQETNEQVQAGFLMFVPLYKQGASLENIENRRASLIGYVNAAFRMDDLMAGLGSEHSIELDLEIYDGDEISDLTRMYDSDGIPVNLDADDPRLKHIQHITIADHDWTLAIQSSPDFEARIDNTKPVFVAVAGVVFSILLALLALAYLRSKNITSELHESEERWRFALEGAGDGVWD